MEQKELIIENINEPLISINSHKIYFTKNGEPKVENAEGYCPDYEYHSVCSIFTNIDYPIQKLKLENYNSDLFNFPEDYSKLNIKSEFDIIKHSLDIYHQIEEINFGNSFNKIPNILPRNIKKITFGFQFNQIIDNLPNTIEFIELGNFFNKSIDNLPSSLKKLKIIGVFNQLIDFLPPNLEELIIDDRFDQPIDNLPTNLKILELGDSFNQSVDNLPSSLQRLKLGGEFNKSINNLPMNLNYLNISSNNLVGVFNQSLDNLPEKLDTLILPDELDYNFTYSFNNLPSNLRVLQLFEDHTQRICLENIPDSIEKLRTNIRSLPTKIPKNLKKIVLTAHSDILTENLEIFERKDVDIKIILSLYDNNEIDIIPEGITRLKLINCTSNNDNLRIKRFPSTLKVFTTFDDYDAKLRLPNGLKSLKLGSCFNQPLLDLPDSIEYIRLGDSFDERINYVPKNLKRIDVYRDKNNYRKIKIPKTSAIISYIRN